MYDRSHRCTYIHRYFSTSTKAYCVRQAFWNEFSTLPIGREKMKKKKIVEMFVLSVFAIYFGLIACALTDSIAHKHAHVSHAFQA